MRAALFMVGLAVSRIKQGKGTGNHVTTSASLVWYLMRKTISVRNLALITQPRGFPILKAHCPKCAFS